jgi:hypothetical protein
MITRGEGMANKVYVNRAKLNAVGIKEANAKVRRVVRRTDARSAILCPVDTGNLRSNRTSGVKVAGLQVRGEVEYHADYAAAVHNGRRALTIRARGGGRLRFVVDGQVVYAREVRQPARAGRPFLSNALREVATAEGFTVSR